MNTENEKAGRRLGDDAEIWAEENAAELDRPLTNRAFLAGCSLIAEAVLYASPRDDSSYGQEAWRRTLNRLKETFVEDWRSDQE